VDNLIKQIPDFEAQTGVKVNVQNIDYDAMTQKETLDLKSKTGQYDVFWTEGTFLGRYVGSLNGLEPIEDLAAAQGVDLGLSDVPDQLKANFSYNGKLYAMPFEATQMLAAYRTDLYDAAKLQPATALDAYLSNVAGLSKPPVYGTEIMGQKGEPIFYEYINWLWGRGGALFNPDGSPALDTPQALAAGNDLLTLAKSAPPDTANFGWDEAATAFAQGNASTAVLFSDQTPSLLDPTSSKVVGKWAYAPFPGDKATAFGGYGWGINASSKNKPAALAFVEWATSPKVLQSLVPGGSSPPRTSIVTDSALQDQYPWLKAEAAAAPRAQVPTADPKYFELVDSLSTELNTALTGGKTMEKALADAQAKWKTILNK
jgi:multiple sugar transport system substrate-binding protein